MVNIATGEHSFQINIDRHLDRGDRKAITLTSMCIFFQYNSSIKADTVTFVKLLYVQGNIRAVLLAGEF